MARHACLLPTDLSPAQLGVLPPASAILRATLWPKTSSTCNVAFRGRLPRRTTVNATDESVRQKYRQEYEKREQDMKKQVNSLRSEARERMTRLVDSFKAPKSSSTTSLLTSSTVELRERIATAIEVMQRGLVERDTEVRLLLLAALAGEHVLYIGPPGTAKSELSRRLSKLYAGTYFERLLTRFSVPEELFGPLSMRALEDDQYVRQTAGYLPDASVAFIDEVFKANSAILNTLLTLLNERLFDNGSQRVPVPLICLVAASNELPESEELDALYDRFLIRRQVQQVSAQGLAQLLTQQVSGGPIGLDSIPSGLLSATDFLYTRTQAVRQVRVPKEVIDLLTDLRQYLQEKCEPPVYVSDRRLVKAVTLMQVAAFTNGRDSVSLYDCLLLQNVLWNKPEESERIADWLLSQLAADDGIKPVDYILANAFARACKSLGNEKECQAILKEVGELREVLTEKLAAVNASMGGEFPAVSDNLWLGKDEAEAVKSALLPKLDKSKMDIGSTLFEVVQLEVALEGTRDAVALAELLPKRWADFIRNG